MVCTGEPTLLVAKGRTRLVVGQQICLNRDFQADARQTTERCLMNSKTVLRKPTTHAPPRSHAPIDRDATRSPRGGCWSLRE